MQVILNRIQRILTDSLYIDLRFNDITLIIKNFVDETTLDNIYDILDSKEAANIITMRKIAAELEPYAPILSRGSLTVLSPKQLAAMSMTDTIAYLSKLIDSELYETYEFTINYKSYLRDMPLSRTERITLMAKSFHELSTMHPAVWRVSLAVYDDLRSRRSSLHRRGFGDDLIFVSGTQTAYYAYNALDLTDTIDDNMNIPRAADDPARATHGDYFTSEEILSFPLVEDFPIFTKEFADHHRKILAKERARKVEVTLRLAGMRAGGYEEELWIRNLR